ncbi:Sigma factor (plasmid) [Pseudorhizobium banfieldiae]|uniref:Sigma factor n=1 Tax=Pseudorhizobium banfieldiae TaxID=1125847 RepID=L0NM62_9HYPH|nr:MULTISPECIES: sigma-70 family RNA polymerase sigma factor [Pseudorhizobium]CAD6628615.1 RNA polymerase sigma factor [arsenite-oxidising bacterium NT-25]CCF22163.1 Sigma factor [Pseudorhizobium banfieldiae]
MSVQVQQQDGWYLVHRSALIDYASSILRSREAAEDIVQEAYLRLAPERAATLGTAHRVSYLYRIVRNLALDALKRRGIERRGHCDDPPFWILPQPVETPEQTIILRDQAEVAAAALARLPEDVRIAVQMYRHGGHTLQEVASHLGVSVATAHRYVRDAMVKIAVALDEEVR